MKDIEARGQIASIKNQLTTAMDNSKNKFHSLEYRYDCLFNAYTSILSDPGSQRLMDKIEALMTHLSLEFEDIKPGIRVRNKK